MNIEHRTLNVQHRIMNSVYFKKDRAKRFHPSTFDIRYSSVLPFAFSSLKFHTKIMRYQTLYQNTETLRALIDQYPIPRNQQPATRAYFFFDARAACLASSSACMTAAPAAPASWILLPDWPAGEAPACPSPVVKLLSSGGR